MPVLPASPLRATLTTLLLLAACGPDKTSTDGTTDNGTSSAGTTDNGTSSAGTTTSVSPTGTGDTTLTDTGTATTTGATTTGATDDDATGNSSSPTTSASDGTTGATDCPFAGSTDCAVLVAASDELTMEQCTACQGAPCGTNPECDGQYPCVDDKIVLQGCCTDEQCAGLTPFCGMFIATNNICVLSDDV